MVLRGSSIYPGWQRSSRPRKRCSGVIIFDAVSRTSRRPFDASWQFEMRQCDWVKRQGLDVAQVESYTQPIMCRRMALLTSGGSAQRSPRPGPDPGL